MVSPVDTSVKHFRSDINTSLVLNGTAGSLIGLLDACLVNGFGLQTASSVTVDGGVCSITTPTLFQANEYMVILVEGATGAWVDLNGEQKLTERLIASNTIRFATDLPDGTATGTITVKVAPAGWEKVYSGTNKAVYKILDPQAHLGGMYLRVDDSAAQSARVIGYESMTDVDTGSGMFPTTSLFSGGGYWHKSNSSNTVGTRWGLYADSRFFVTQFVPYSSTTPSNETGFVFCFGDCVPYRLAGDPHAALLNASTAAAPSTTNQQNLFGGSGGGTSGRWVPRNYSGLGGASEVYIQGLMGSASSISGGDTTFGQFPSEVSGHLLLSPRVILHNGGSNNYPLRATIPGVYHVPQSALAGSFGIFNKLEGGFEFSGKKLMAVPVGNTASSAAMGVGFIDITGPWR